MTQIWGSKRVDSPLDSSLATPHQPLLRIPQWPASSCYLALSPRPIFSPTSSGWRERPYIWSLTPALRPIILTLFSQGTKLPLSLWIRELNSIFQRANWETRVLALRWVPVQGPYKQQPRSALSDTLPLPPWTTTYYWPSLSLFHYPFLGSL